MSDLVQVNSKANFYTINKRTSIDEASDAVVFETVIKNLLSKLSTCNFAPFSFKHNYSLKKVNKNEKDVLEQTLTIQDTNGKVIQTIICKTDVSELTNEKEIHQESLVSNLFSDNNLEKLSLVLSPKETKIVSLLAKGLTSRQISIELKLSKYTVDTHRKNILRKTNCNSTTELISKALNKDWVSF